MMTLCNGDKTGLQLFKALLQDIFRQIVLKRDKRVELELYFGLKLGDHVGYSGKAANTTEPRLMLLK